ncbi:hypothetical protein K431DRAFT_121374 [Polychaeton citri CBS 116435]|uniref:Uncharacterized protein n=1 Tax=Polychaeton citri CBS 116435 TaxID=1314669 RepID=A0A9P4Q3K7_9PEZI|nr:hypothetical protein K431DRAFT_121374 [Polychaeton citri CBS 116435]
MSWHRKRFRHRRWLLGRKTRHLHRSHRERQAPGDRAPNRARAQPGQTRRSTRQHPEAERARDRERFARSSQSPYRTRPEAA